MTYTTSYMVVSLSEVPQEDLRYSAEYAVCECGFSWGTTSWEQTSWGKTMWGVVPSVDTCRKTALVVHDERVVADCMAILLTRAGFAVAAAYDGTSALEMALAMRPELLVSDIGIRGIDGIRLAMAVVEAMPECKVLLFSGHETDAEVESAREGGYDFLSLVKPVHPADMLKRVTACFGSRADGGRLRVAA